MRAKGGHGLPADRSHRPVHAECTCLRCLFACEHASYHVCMHVREIAREDVCSVCVRCVCGCVLCVCALCVHVFVRLGERARVRARARDL